MWYHTNFIGTVNALTDVDQTTVETYDYDAYGIPLAAPGQTPNAFRYVGQLGYYKDPDHAPSPKRGVEAGRAESGLWRASHLMLLGARYYDPFLGRFITQDPVGYLGGMNLYAYAGNSPVGSADPAGLWGPAIHRDKTLVWAKELGICDKAARAIADAAIAPDDDRDLYPREQYHNRYKRWWWFGRDRRIETVKKHMKQAKGDAKGALCESALENLGYGLHALQDIEAHGGARIHRTAMDDPKLDRHGKPDPNQTRVNATRDATKEYLREALADACLKCCLTDPSCKSTKKK